MITIKEWVKDYDYKKSKVKQMVNIKDLGLSNDHYGGNINSFAAKIDNGMHLILDKDLNTIDVCLYDLENINMNLLKQAAKLKKIEFDWGKITKEELIKLM